MSDTTERDDGYGNAMLDLDDEPKAVDESKESASKATKKGSSVKAKLIFGGAALSALGLLAVLAMQLTPNQPTAATPGVASTTRDVGGTPPASSPAEQIRKEIRDVAQIVDRSLVRIDSIENTLQQHNQVLNQFNSAIRALRDELNSIDVLTSSSTADREITNIEQQVQTMRVDMEALQRTVRQQASSLERAGDRISELQTSTRANAGAIGNQSVSSRNTREAPRVTGEVLHIISAAEGIAFLRRMDTNSEPFSLEVGESLRGWGRVSRVTPLGCIHIGDEVIRPANSAC